MNRSKYLNRNYIESFLREMPKVELHLHLDGSLYPCIATKIDKKKPIQKFIINW